VGELAEKGIDCEQIRCDSITGEKMTFFHDPDGLPIKIHE
jgi:glyoxylase I family protein